MGFLNKPSLVPARIAARVQISQQVTAPLTCAILQISDEDYARQLGVVDILPIVVKGNLQKCEENALSQLRAPEVQPALLHDVLMAESCPVVAHVGVSMIQIAHCSYHLF